MPTGCATLGNVIQRINVASTAPVEMAMTFKIIQDHSSTNAADAECAKQSQTAPNSCKQLRVPARFAWEGCNTAASIHLKGKNCGVTLAHDAHELRYSLDVFIRLSKKYPKDFFKRLQFLS